MRKTRRTMMQTKKSHEEPPQWLPPLAHGTTIIMETQKGKNIIKVMIMRMKMRMIIKSSFETMTRRRG
jgi:hypothetical protein